MKLSIITINWNNATGLDKTISSVVSQTSADIEYLVIDGGSTDDSVSVIKKYQDKINYWVSERDSGIYNAMNKGIKRASGEYCLFLNSGDYLMGETVIDELLSLNYSQDLIYGNIKCVDADNAWEKRYPDALSPLYLWNDTLPHPATLIKKDLFTRVGLYDESFKISADHDFFLKAVVVHGCTYIHCPLVMSVFHIDGLSSDPKNASVIADELRASFKNNLPLFFDDYLMLMEFIRKAKRVSLPVRLWKYAKRKLSSIIKR